jgi:ELWxxDGT repeat protein
MFAWSSKVAGFCALIVLAFTATSAHAAGPTYPSLVKRINSGSTDSYPHELVSVKNQLFFVANDGVLGAELWKSDSTAGGTVLVKDICPGACDSSPSNLTDVNGILFFAASDGTSGIELWRSDGTSAGTVRVKDINPGAGSASPRALANANGTLFFAANDGANDALWKSNGTAAGTVVVKKVSLSMAEHAIVPVSSQVFFMGYDATNGPELWVSDGSDTGTRACTQTL